MIQTTLLLTNLPLLDGKETFTALGFAPLQRKKDQNAPNQGTATEDAERGP